MIKANKSNLKKLNALDPLLKNLIDFKFAQMKWKNMKKFAIELVGFHSNKGYTQFY